MSSSEIEPAEDLSACAARLESALLTGGADAVPEDLRQRLLAACAKVYAAQIDAGRPEAPVTDDSLSATETMVLVTALLKAARLELFELGMWQSWSGQR